MGSLWSHVNVKCKQSLITVKWKPWDYEFRCVQSDLNVAFYLFFLFFCKPCNSFFVLWAFVQQLTWNSIAIMSHWMYQYKLLINVTIESVLNKVFECMWTLWIGSNYSFIENTLFPIFKIVVDERHALIKNIYSTNMHNFFMISFIKTAKPTTLSRKLCWPQDIWPWRHLVFNLATLVWI